MAEVAAHDYARALDVCRWPVIEVLHAYQERLRRRAVEEYRNACLVWASLAPWQKKKTAPPAVPEILKDE